MMKFDTIKERFDDEKDIEKLKKDFEEMCQTFQKDFNFAISVQIIILLVVALHLYSYLHYEDESPLKFLSFSMVAAVWFWHAILKGLRIRSKIKEIRTELYKQGKNKNE